MRYFTIEQRESLRTILLESEQSERTKEEAIARLRSPYFGICTECEGDITFRFLKSNPFATVCEKCQQGKELAPPLVLNRIQVNQPGHSLG